MWVQSFELTKFFQPSAQLATQIWQRVEELRQLDLKRIEDDSEQVESGDSLESVLASDASCQEEAESREERPFAERVVAPLQRKISDELYYHLAFLARSSKGSRGEPFSMEECVNRGMSRVLGMAEKDQLLKTLADAFSDWMKTVGEFSAGWGNIVLAGEEAVYLKAHGRSGNEAGSNDEHSSSFVLPYRNRVLITAEPDTNVNTEKTRYAVVDRESDPI